MYLNIFVGILLNLNDLSASYSKCLRQLILVFNSTNPFNPCLEIKI